MDLDFKVINWERVIVETENKEKVLKLLKEGKIKNSNDVVEMGLGTFVGVIFDTTAQMSVEENNGCSTIELLEGGDVIWQEVED